MNLGNSKSEKENTLPLWTVEYLVFSQDFVGHDKRAVAFGEDVGSNRFNCSLLFWVQIFLSLKHAKVYRSPPGNWEVNHLRGSLGGSKTDQKPK